MKPSMTPAAVEKLADTLGGIWLRSPNDFRVAWTRVAKHVLTHYAPKPRRRAKGRAKR